MEQKYIPLSSYAQEFLNSTNTGTFSPPKQRLNGTLVVAHMAVLFATTATLVLWKGRSRGSSPCSSTTTSKGPSIRVKSRHFSPRGGQLVHLHNAPRQRCRPGEDTGAASGTLKRSTAVTRPTTPIWPRAAHNRRAFAQWLLSAEPHCQAMPGFQRLYDAIAQYMDLSKNI